MPVQFIRISTYFCLRTKVGQSLEYSIRSILKRVELFYFSSKVADFYILLLFHFFVKKFTALCFLVISYAARKSDNNFVQMKKRRKVYKNGVVC